MKVKELTHKKLFLLVSFIVWTSVALFDFARLKIMELEGSIRFGGEITVNDFGVSAFIKFYIWFLLGILIYEVFQRVKNKRIERQILLLFLLGIFCVSIHYIIGNLTWNLYLSGTQDLLGKLNTALNRFFSNMPMSSLTYGVIILILITLEFNRKYQEQYINSLTLESELSKSQLSNLKMQLKPHFMFNALNTISMLVRRNRNDEAIDMISGMSDLLRTTLSREEAQLVTFGYELELLKKYLIIEQARFKETLSINFDIDPSAKEVLVPNLILQPIVENAFKHGVSENFETSSIHVIAQVKDEKLCLIIENIGPELPHGWSLEESEGIGLRNTISRLEKLYGDRQDFSITNLEHAKGVSVKISIPIELGQE